MAKVIILGSSAAVPDETQENTHFILTGNERSVLVDCAGSPIARLFQAGLDPLLVTDLVLTHFHPDHVSGGPGFLMSSWLLGRKKPLDIYGLQYTLDRFERMMELYEWTEWPNFFPVRFHRLPEVEMAPLLSSEEFNIFVSPVRHLVPTIGMRVEFLQTGRVLAFSCDTEPCEQVIRLAAGADLLIHEATGGSKGHSSASQAGTIARQAEVGGLALIHYRTGEAVRQPLLDEAQQTFGAPVILAEDFMEFTF